MNNLFNDKILTEKAKSEIDIHSERFKEQREVIDKWISMKDSGTLATTKEEQLQGEFIGDIFSKILGAKNITDGGSDWNLERETKTFIDGQKPDGTLGFFKMDENKKKLSDIRAVIELKGVKINLDTRQKRVGDTRTAVEQAFGYAPKYGTNCQWIIVSNFNEIRLYKSGSMLEYQVFTLEGLKDDVELSKFIYLFSFDSLIGKNGKKPKTQILAEEYIVAQNEIEKDFYNKYKKIRIEIFENMKKNNSEIETDVIIEKVQKLLDRFLFICFAEDKGLLPSNSYKNLVKRGEAWDDVFESFKAFCSWIDTGNKKKNIPYFNGGLFRTDAVLNNLIVDDDVFRSMESIADYDFDSALNETILGHIFEQSISDIEELKNENFDKKESKRKKDGIFYTPKFITKYIVENTIDSWIEDKKEELGESELPELEEKDFNRTTRNKIGKKLQLHIDFWTRLRDALRNIKVIDPACGSGAFLIEAFDYLVKQYNYIDDKLFDLTGVRDLFYDKTKNILENNIFGVDLNKESVEITKLALWLRTADKNKALTTLENNIKAGNSLVSDPVIAGDLAFDWEKEFEDIFANGGFDVVIGNPPYVKEYTAKEAFDGLHEHPCYQGKMDLWYFFGDLALNILKENGIVGYIAPNNWITNSGASKFRDIILNKGKFIKFVDFADYKIFESAGIQTMIYIMKKSKDNEDYTLDYSKILNSKIFQGDVIRFLTKEKSPNYIYFKARINKKESLGNFIEFIDGNIDIVLNKIKEEQNFEFDKKEIAQGIVAPQDFLNKKNAELLGKEFNIGDGIFNLSNQEKNDLNLIPKELELIKPFYTSKELGKYYGNNENKFWIIYTDSSFKNKESMDYLPNLKKHLDKFKKVITSSNKPYGLHRAREEKFFTGEKIISLRKCQEPTFTYTDFPCYVSQTYFSIKSDRINMKFLTSLLNSKLIKFWLKFKGKMQGDLYQIDKEPLMNLPIKTAMSNIENVLIENCESIIPLYKNLNKKINKFKNRVIGNFALSKFSKTLENFYELTFNEFKDEIEKIKKQKITLTLKEQDEWEEYFESYKKEISEIQQEIAKTDETINDMVYKLYNLTDEEIAIIEQVN